jgi:integrase
MSKRHLPYLGANGRFRVEIGAKNFWLGKERDQANKVTAALDVAWASETNKNAEGKKCWSQANIDAAFSLVGVQTPTRIVKVANTTTNSTNEPKASNGRFHNALDLWAQYRRGNKRLRDHTGEDSESIVKSLKRVLPDMALNAIDGAALQRFSDAIIARPPRLKDGQSISVITAKKWLLELAMALEWFGHNDNKWWQPPYADWRKEKFALNEKEMKNLAKGDKSYGKVKPTFTLDHLIILYKVATPKERLYLLCGVALGWTAIEMATLQSGDYRDEGGELFIEKERSKTGVSRKFWVWPELAVIFRRCLKNMVPNPGDLVLMTENRQGDPLPLVHGKTDTVAQTWERLISRANKAEQRVPNYPHSRLRKFAGQLIENLSGNHGFAQMILAHKHADVASTNYTGLGVNLGIGQSPNERFWEAQKLCHQALKPMFDAVKPKAKPQATAA